MGKYDHLLAPIKVGTHLFKNHIIMTPTTPHFLQEDEGWPAENLMQHYLRRARNGAALITFSGLFPFKPEDPLPDSIKYVFVYNLDKGDHHYMSQMVEGVHGFGTLATIQLQHIIPPDYDICAGAKAFTHFEALPTAAHEITVDELKAATDEMVRKCLILKSIGFDGVFLHMSYQQTVLGRSISPLINQRVDRYGGSFENRIRLVTETCEAIKKACGKDFLIEVHITGEDRDGNNELVPGGWTLDDSVRFAEAMSGLIDILHLRGWNVDEQHPMWMRPDEPPYLYMAARCKEAVTETKILCTAGNKNPDMMEAAIAEGKTDFIGMTRSLIADPYFIEKLYEDRADDIRPCIRCNKCFEHGAPGTPKTSRCSVNPLWGFESRERILFPPAHDIKKVAVIGGGASGMEVATVCKHRGHEVTLFEKSDKLGGQLKIADHAKSKWAIRDYKDYLVHQVDKLGIDVRLNTEFVPDMISAEAYDVVFATLGSKPKMPAIPGIDDIDATTILDVYGNEEKLGKKVVIVGGGASAVETGMHLAEDFDRDVTVLGRNALIAKDLSTCICRSMEESDWEAIENLTTVTEATVVAVSDKGVAYTDAAGIEHLVKADSVVIGIGMEALTDEALALYGHGARLIVVGDNRIPGNILDLVRDAYFAAAQI